jgi:hypothetical protein
MKFIIVNIPGSTILCAMRLKFYKETISGKKVETFIFTNK